MIAASSDTAPTHATERSQRSDGAQSRRRLCDAALELFAQQGFARTSTRAIARAAGTNVAAISYHFGDKAGLYRAVFTEPAHTPSPQAAAAEPDTQGAIEADPLVQALGRLFDGFVEPLRQGDAARRCMKLHLREILEPTGLWQHGVAAGFEDQHRTLVAALCRHLGLARADTELRRLALCIAGLGVQLHIGRDMADAVAPGLGRGPRALALWKQRLLMYALAMVDAERQRRRASPPTR
jgi:AcrR family transcriptional regulator